MMKVSISALFVVCMLGAVAAAPSAWLRDYLEPPKAKSLSRYEKLDTKTVCFRQESFCHIKCDAQGNSEKCDLDTFNDYSNLACTVCPEDQHHQYNHYHRPEEQHKREMFMELVSDIHLSKCYMYKVRNNPVPVAGKAGVSQVGTFTGLCRLNEEAECVNEGCEGVEVAITGLVYQLDQAVRVGPRWGGAPADIPNQCKKNAENPIRDGSNFDEGASGEERKVVGKAATPAKIQLTPSTPDEENVVVGKATVYTGPFTVHSSGPLKYQRGYFQFSFFSNDDGTPVPANTVSTLPRFGDETYKFEFIDERPLPGRY